MSVIVCSSEFQKTIFLRSLLAGCQGISGLPQTSAKLRALFVCGRPCLSFSPTCVWKWIYSQTYSCFCVSIQEPHFCRIACLSVISAFHLFNQSVLCGEQNNSCHLFSYYLGSDYGSWISKDISSEDSEGGLLLLAPYHQVEDRAEQDQNQCHHLQKNLLQSRFRPDCSFGLFGKYSSIHVGLYVAHQQPQPTIISLWQSCWTAPSPWLTWNCP